MADCICDWPSGCDGTGIVYCGGCGGDLCVCRCGGESECYGCDYCDTAYRQESMFGEEEP